MFSRISIAPILTPEQLTSGDRLSRLQRLRELPGVLKTPPQPKSYLHDGISIPCGAITEISGPAGSGKTEWTLRFIAQHFAQPFALQDPGSPGRHFTQTRERIGTVGAGEDPSSDRKNHDASHRISWIEDSFSANPRGFAEHGVGLDQFLFVEGGKDSLWATHQVLRSQLFSVVVLWVRERILSASEPSVELRKLQLSAEQAKVPLLLLSPQPRPSGANWPVALQVAMDPLTRRPSVLSYSPRSEHSRSEEVGHERTPVQRTRRLRSGLRTA